MTRTDSRALEDGTARLCVATSCNLVTGCETGHDAAVPFVHYFEGMLSLGPYRVPDAGRRHGAIWTNVPERVAKFQLGQHVSAAALGTGLSRLRRGPMVLGRLQQQAAGAVGQARPVQRALWHAADVHVRPPALGSRTGTASCQSYRNTCPWVREFGYAEMTDHRFLTPDRNVQQTVFANGLTITVNFGSEPFKLPDGRTVAGMGFQVD